MRVRLDQVGAVRFLVPARPSRQLRPVLARGGRRSRCIRGTARVPLQPRPGWAEPADTAAVPRTSRTAALRRVVLLRHWWSTDGRRTPGRWPGLLAEWIATARLALGAAGRVLRQRRRRRHAHGGLAPCGLPAPRRVARPARTRTRPGRGPGQDADPAPLELGVVLRL